MQISSSCCKEEQSNPKLFYFIFPKRSRAKGSMCLPLGRRGERTKKEEGTEGMPEGTGHVFPKALQESHPGSKSPPKVQQHFCPYFRAGYSSAGQTFPFLIKTWKTISIPSILKVPSWAGAALWQIFQVWGFFFPVISP